MLVVFAAVCLQAAVGNSQSPKLTGLLSSLQSHGQQEEGHCPAGKPQGVLASSTWGQVGVDEEWKAMYKGGIICQQDMQCSQI